MRTASDEQKKSIGTVCQWSSRQCGKKILGEFNSVYIYIIAVMYALYSRFCNFQEKINADYIR